MKTLTLRQTEVLCSIADFVEEHGYPPTIRELADRFGISIKGAYDHIKALERKGQLRLGDNRSRAIEIIPQAPGDSRKSEVPLLGSVAAGRPLFADENFEGSVEVPKEMTRSGSCFALRVKGDSMKDAGIYDEDLAIIEERPTADNGEIVVAMIDDAVTLKRFYRENNRVKLVAENAAYSPIYTQDVRIIGRLRGIIRSY